MLTNTVRDPADLATRHPRTVAVAVAVAVVMSAIASGAALSQEAPVAAPHPAQFWGEAFDAASIVYVIDSAAISAARTDLLRELKQSVSELKLGQTFNALVFGSATEGMVETSFIRRLFPSMEPAAVPKKQSFFEWIDGQNLAEGGDPLPALKRALALRPQAIVFISTGHFAKSIPAELGLTEQFRKIKIRCFMLSEKTLRTTRTVDANTDPRLGLMTEIARGSGGSVTVITGKRRSERRRQYESPDSDSKPKLSLPKKNAAMTAGDGPLGRRIEGKRIAYVVDFSGSTITIRDDVIRAIESSLGDLEKAQKFDCLIFYERGGKYVTDEFAPRFVPASASNKIRFSKWIKEQIPMGRTDPLGAIKKALELRPDVLVFISDGFFDDDIVDEVTRANRRVKAAFYCFVFDEVLLQDTTGLEPRKTDGARRMERLARQNGGLVKIVTRSDLPSP